MKQSQRLYASPSITKDAYHEKSKSYHKRNLGEIRHRKNKMYKLNEDYLDIMDKKRSQSPPVKNINCKFF